MENLHFTFLIILSSMLILATISNSTEGDKWIEVFNSRKKTPDATLLFYVQANVSGPQATGWEVARANITSNSTTNFGRVRVTDALITSGPDPKSIKLGRAQGMITNSDLHQNAMVIDLIFMFDKGWYKGASLSMLGRIQVSGNNMSELIVAGGTGIFQMARGYANNTIYNTSVNGNRQLASATFYYEVYLYHPAS